MMDKIKEWLMNIKYKGILSEYFSRKEVSEFQYIENFLSSCDVFIFDYSNCEDIPTTIGAKIVYENKEFFFYEFVNKRLDSGARKYEMKYDGSGVKVNLKDKEE